MRAPLDPRLGIAFAVALVLLAAGVATVLGGQPPFEASSRDIVGLLVATGALCLAALSAARSPVVAWPALVLVGIAATGVPVRLAAALEPGPAIAWAPVALVVASCASGATLVGALYATRPERAPSRPIRWLAWGLTAWLALAAFATIALALAGQQDTPAVTPLDLLTFPVQAWLPIVVLLAALGGAADVWPAVERTRVRVAVGGGARPGPAGWVATLFDELLGRGEERRAAAAAERRRLASELHAEAMPALRRALRDLEGGRPAAEVAAALRALAGELEGVVTERRDPLLEALGLVRALEALAERTEDRGGPRVELELGAPETDGPQARASETEGRTARAKESDGRPPPAVEAAALQIAGLAIDNATRHASPTIVRVTVEADADRVRLEVADDGAGIAADAEARALAVGRQGIPDMRRLAGEQGARLFVGRGASGGTIVRFEWPS